MKDFFNTVFDVYRTFIPEEVDINPAKRESASFWKKIAINNANVIVGMVLGQQATVEQLKQIKEILESQKK